MRLNHHFIALFIFLQVNAQQTPVISGKVIDIHTKYAIGNAIISIEGLSIQTTTNSDGKFELLVPLKGEYIVTVLIKDFIQKRIPIVLDSKALNIGTILLGKDISVEQVDNLITLTEADLSDDAQSISVSTGLLQATKDIFLTKAAFDFGQAFFRVRGYDSREGQVLINGIPMNKTFNGRPQWNNWGGLNDIVRNQTFTNGLEASDYTFGGILGNTFIDTRPSQLRKGTRLSTSASNRTYFGRLMATHNSGLKENGLAYALSASRRWANEGYIDGTLYDAYSFFGALEYHLNDKHSLMATALVANNRRGRSSAVTEEVFDLLGNQYNPYWGNQDGEIRNAREQRIFEPIIMLNHYFKSESFDLISAISYQFGTTSRSRLAYFNAPNPDPTYYRYLPSFYSNNPVGANFVNAALAREALLENPQINWQNIYTANANSSASYLIQDDINKDRQLTFNTIGNWKMNSTLKIDFGMGYRKLLSHNYAEIKDLLGSDVHQDRDPFSDTLNDVAGNLDKTEGAIFGYNYEMGANSMNGFAQISADFDSWSAFLSGEVSKTEFRRNGLFQNERFPTNSEGKSDRVGFSNYGIKAGFRYTITGRHWLSSHTTFSNRAPLLQNVFINPRENNTVVPNIQNENLSSIDLNYFLRLPDLTGRISGFYTRFQNTTDINFFFVDSGLGSDFVQEVITGSDKLHMGIEMGLQYQLSPSVKLNTAVNIGKYLFANDPSVTINFDPSGREEETINPEGNQNLGLTNIKDYKLAQGPQKAIAFGIEYRDPKYWWIAATANYLANNYANISTITRTQSFLLNPETGERFPNATSENVQKLLAQNPLDNFYLLNLVGGKSWLIDGKYISFFASINNVFDSIYRSGGYEQSRNGNFGQLLQDNLSGTPSFAPKYWYGFGRTYFLNLAISF